MTIDGDDTDDHINTMKVHAGQADRNIMGKKTMSISSWILILLLSSAWMSNDALSFHISSTSSRWTPPTTSLATTASNRHRLPNNIIHRKSIILNGLFDGNNNNDDNDSSNTKPSIPPDLLAEITQAEANTPAAQSRNQRIILYFTLTLLGVTTAFFNAFLSSLRYGEGSPSSDLAYYGFEWVQSNWITGFLFTNKIGGGLGLLGAGLAGTLAEVEIRSKSEAIDKIWEEMQRRQSLREGGGSSGSSGKNKNKKKSSMSSSSRPVKKEKKRRLSPLEELSYVENDNDGTVIGTGSEDGSDALVTTTADNNSNSDDEAKIAVESSNKDDDGGGGIVGAISRFYKQADNMAASQALLLNKELEDRGILEKITDETGLRVVGKQKKEEKEEEVQSE